MEQLKVFILCLVFSGCATAKVSRNISSFTETDRSSLPTIDLKSRADKIVESLQAAELWIGGAVIVANGTNTEVGVYGTKRPNKNSVRPNGNSHFEIGSVSKSFTGILLAWVIGKYPHVHFDDPIGKFAPQIRGAFAQKITLRALANQTSGLSADFCVKEVASAEKCYQHPADPENPWADLKESDLLAYLNAFHRPDSGPFAYVYSNPGFITLGYVLSQITKRSYEQLLTEVITGPLQMNDTLVNLPGSSVSDYLPGYNVIQLPEKHWQFSPVAAPTGGIVSTPNDMAKYLTANLNPSNSHLGQAIKLSQTSGLGWDSAPGTSVVWKNGGTNGFSSYIMIDSIHHQAWFATSNLGSSYSADYFPDYAIFGGVRPDILGMPLSDESLNAFVGTYKCVKQSNPILISKPAHYLRFNGGDVSSDFRLQAVSAVDFATMDSEHYNGFNRLTFQKDAHGRTQGFTFHLNDGAGHYTDFTFDKVN